jgi:hypothetical protein
MKSRQMSLFMYLVLFTLYNMVQYLVTRQKSPHKHAAPEYHQILIECGDEERDVLIRTIKMECHIQPDRNCGGNR